MGNVRENSFAKMYHMTNIQPKSMFWYVMSTEELQKMSSLHYEQMHYEAN